ncbi:MAG: ribosome maturation factor RimP [Clostridia bacterium]|nr:ribosome maturation factor RimP [Clostridia bacterium]
MAKVKEICEEKLKGIIEELGYELVEVSYEKENGGMSLIFTIDKEEGVTIDDCEIVNKKIDPIMDELNPTDDKPYTLVVSSPGLDRPLKTDRDLSRSIGKEVDLNLYVKLDGKKAFSGILKAYDEKSVTLQTEKEDLTFDREKVASIKLVIKF